MYLNLYFSITQHCQKGIKYVLKSFKLEWAMCTKYVWGKLWKQTHGKSKETGKQKEIKNPGYQQNRQICSMCFLEMKQNFTFTMR